MSRSDLRGLPRSGWDGRSRAARRAAQVFALLVVLLGLEAVYAMVLAMKRRNDLRAHNHPAWWAFLVHRMSGLALALFLPLHFWALSTALRGSAGLDGFLRFADRPLFKFAEWGLVILLALHMGGGVRLLLIEFRPWSRAAQGLDRGSLCVWRDGRPGVCVGTRCIERRRAGATGESRNR